MKKIFLLAVFFVFTARSVFSQTIVEPNPLPEEAIFTKTEVEASFPGGASAWKAYLEKNLNTIVPADNGAPAGTYTVIVRFIVAKNGMISDIKADTRNGYGMEMEAIRLIKKSPYWIPARMFDQPVKAYHLQPVVFVVEKE